MEKIDLTKCNNLRYKAKIDGNDDYGRICVENADTGLAFLRSNREDCYVATWHCDCAGVGGYCGRKVTDFEIVPRDPETYQDWQVGDIACEEAHRNTRCEVIFRSGELVFFKDWNNCATNPFTCSEAFRKFRFRLVLTDIEKQIIEERKWKPQAGDICFAESDARTQKFIIIYKDASYSLADLHGTGWKLKEDVLWSYSHIRPATDEERQKLFDAMAKAGKRWNAEWKVVEDIKPGDDEAADVQKMISDALKGYIPKGDIEGFPMEVIEKMLERQYEQYKVVDVSVFEDDRSAGKALSGFTWRDTEEGFNFWWNVISERDFSRFFKMYPKAEAPGAGVPSSFKRFDPVLVRDRDAEGWHPMVFSRKEGDKFYVLSVLGGFVYYNQCIPLNKDTEKLIGTSKQYYE